MQLWETAASVHWDPFDFCAIHAQREVEFSRCGILVATRQSPDRSDLVVQLSALWIRRLSHAQKTGLTQSGFACICIRCRFVITREGLAVAKFVDDFMKDPKNLDDVGQFEDAVYLL